jgi:hypothetical protein
MTVKQLIQALQRFETQHGDLPMHMECDYDPDEVNVVARQTWLRTTSV